MDIWAFEPPITVTNEHLNIFLRDYKSDIKQDANEETPEEIFLKAHNAAFLLNIFITAFIRFSAAVSF